MKIKLAIAGTIMLLLIVAAIGWYLYNKPHAGLADLKTQAHITASQLCNDFELNETLANQKYLNKVLEVTGSIADIQNENGSQIILLSSDNAMSGVNCRLSNPEKSKQTTIKKSETVTIKGRCSGYLMDVNLVDCIIK